MDPREFPTKGNLIAAKNSLTLAKQGYDLMDKKRNILIRELMDLIDEAKDIQEEIDTTFTRAYACLQRANIQHGISKVEELAYTVQYEPLPNTWSVWIREQNEAYLAGTLYTNSWSCAENVAKYLTKVNATPDQLI